MARKKLGEMLVEAGVLSEQKLRMALNEQRRWGGTLGRTLVETKAISESELVRVLSLQLGLQSVDLDTVQIDPTVLELVPADFAEQHSLIPFAQTMEFLDVAMAEPTNIGVVDELRIRTQLTIRPYLTGPKMIERALARHYRRAFGRYLSRRDVSETGEIDAASASSPHLRRQPTGEIDAASASSPNLRRQPTGEIDAASASPHRRRQPTDEIEAARRQEGLPSGSRPTRQPPLDPSMTPSAALGQIGPPQPRTRDAEIDALQERISTLETLVERDEEVLRKLLALLVKKNVATRDEMLEAIR